MRWLTSWGASRLELLGTESVHDVLKFDPRSEGRDLLHASVSWLYRCYSVSSDLNLALRGVRFRVFRNLLALVFYGRHVSPYKGDVTWLTMVKWVGLAVLVRVDLWYFCFMASSFSVLSWTPPAWKSLYESTCAIFFSTAQVPSASLSLVTCWPLAKKNRDW
jgi:hypothetical protein